MEVSPIPGTSALTFGAMLVMLPPSEGKAMAPAGSPPVNLDTLVHPELAPQRLKLIEKLDGLTKIQPARALRALALSKGQADEIARNRDLLNAPAAAASDIYTGVLFQNLGLGSLQPADRKRAGARLMIASALWGVLRIDDHIPAYRLGCNAKLPRIKGLAAWWRPTLTKVMPDDAFVVDMRSQGYTAMWRPPAGNVIEVRAVLETDGKRKVITHMAKATRGELARVLCESPSIPTTAEAVAEIAERAGMRVELAEPADSRSAYALTVVRDTI